MSLFNRIVVVSKIYDSQVFSARKIDSIANIIHSGTLPNRP